MANFPTRLILAYWNARRHKNLLSNRQRDASILYWCADDDLDDDNNFDPTNRCAITVIEKSKSCLGRLPSWWGWRQDQFVDSQRNDLVCSRSVSDCLLVAIQSGNTKRSRNAGISAQNRTQSYRRGGSVRWLYCRPTAANKFLQCRVVQQQKGTKRRRNVFSLYVV